MVSTELRYFVFTGTDASSAGGAKDLARRVRIKAEAVAFCDGFIRGDLACKWAHVLDIEDGKIIYEVHS